MNKVKDYFSLRACYERGHDGKVKYYSLFTQHLCIAGAFLVMMILMPAIMLGTGIAFVFKICTEKK